MMFLYKDKLCLLNYSVKQSHCEYYCYLFIIVAVFYLLTLASF